MLGFNSKNVLESEMTALSADGKKFDWDWGDDIRAGVYGIFGKDYSKATLQRKAREKQTEQINSDPEVKKASALAMQMNPGVTPITRRDGETLGDVRTRGAIEQALAQGISSAKNTYEGIDLQGVQTQSDLDERISAYNKNKTRKKKAEEKRIYERDRDRADWLRGESERRADFLLEQQNNRLDFQREQDNLRQDRRDARDRLDRLENRRMTMETNQQQLQLEYARMAQQDKYRAQDKKDKALMMLLQGLGNLGAAFTI